MPAEVFGAPDAPISVGDRRGTNRDLRWRVNDIVVCWLHRQRAVNLAGGSYRAAPFLDPGAPCVLCDAGEPVDVHDHDGADRPYCGQDFMAGTICSDVPHHDGPCSPTCQDCGGDWYLGTCTCRTDGDGEGDEAL